MHHCTTQNAWLRPIVAGYRRSVLMRFASHYTVLGVPETASREEIKACFRRRALQLHPDAGGNDETAATFVQLVLAYEVLSHPDKRKSYDAQRSGMPAFNGEPVDVPGGEAAVGSSSPHASSAETNVYPVEEDARFDDPNRPFGGAVGVHRRARAEGDRPGLWAALARVHAGPAWRGSVSNWPYAFECDERNDALSSDDILQMVVGRTHIGSVRGASLQALPDTSPSEAMQTLTDGVPAASVDAAQRPVQPASSPPRIMRASYESLEFHYHGALLASAMMYGNGGSIAAQASGVRGNAAPTSAGIDDAYECSNYMTIYRHYEDGSRGPPLAHVLAAHGTALLNFRRVVACDLVNAASLHAAAEPPTPPVARSRPRDENRVRVVPASDDASERAYGDMSEGMWRRHSLRTVPAGSDTGQRQRALDRQRKWNQSHDWIAVGDEAVMPSFNMHHANFARPGMTRRPDHRSNAARGWQFGPAPLQRSDGGHDASLVHPRAATHSFLFYRTLGVSNMRWLRHIDGALECSGTRVRLPPAEMWLWDARSSAHTRSGYYFEVARRQAVEAALHPAVYVLTAAAMSLEAEALAAAKDATGVRAAAEQALQQVSSWVSRMSGK